MTIEIYQLSEYGRKLIWETWKFLGGCGLPNNTGAYTKLGPMAMWDEITLGQIEDACPYTGRSLARFAIVNMKMPEFAKPYRSSL